MIGVVNTCGKLYSIARNTFIQSVRQPIYGILILVTFGVLVMDVPLSGYTMGADFTTTDQRMLEDLGLSTLLISGLLISAFTASSALSREIEDRTALTVVSKPVSRAAFVVGKFLGVAAAVILAYYLCSLAFLMTVRQGVLSTAGHEVDMPVLVMGLGAAGLSIVLAALGNYFFGWSFNSAGIAVGAILMSLAMAGIGFVGPDWEIVRFGYREDPRPIVRIEYSAGGRDAILKQARQSGFLVADEYGRDAVTVQCPPNVTLDEGLVITRNWPGALSASVAELPALREALIRGIVLIMMAVLVLAAIALAASTRMGQVMTLIVCLAAFVLGSMHSFLFQGAAADYPILQYAGWLVPKMSYSYPPETPAMERPVPLDYMGMAILYYLAYIAAALAAGVALFQTRSLEAQTASSAPGAVAAVAWTGRAAAAAAAVYALLMATTPRLWSPGALALAGALLAGGAAGWWLFGALGRGARPARLIVMILAGLLLAGTAAAMTADALGAVQTPTVATAVALGVGFIVLSVMLLPRSRAHFRSS
jgi:ABC-type transport system involved in multi-copper enzyme maturation permease subunit